MKKLLLIFLTALSLSAFGQASVITYDDKDKNAPSGDPRKLVRDVDLNEIKTVVNANATLLNAKQTTLVSGTSIKTVNGTPLLGSGDVTISVSSGISGLGTGVATFLATPTSANFAAAVTNETGSGTVVFSTSPTLTTPALGTPSAVILTNGTGLPISGVTDLQTTLNTKTTSTNFAVGVTVTGSINSSNLIYTIAQAIVSGSAEVFLNGVRQVEGVEYVMTYPIGVATITFALAPETGDGIRVNYIRP